jgi:hypothetical protein
MIVKLFEIGTLVFIIFASSYFLGLMWYIFVHDIQDWEHITMTDVYNGYDTFYTYADYRFIVDENGNPTSDWSTLVKVWYYGITTLSTIGFGDFLPKSVNEKVVAAFVMMLGVSIFSYIMGNFIDILISYKNFSSSGDQKDLTKWVAHLTKFNRGQKLDMKLIKAVEDFFDYHRINSPQSCFSSDSDKEMILNLPEVVVHSIFIDYLFREFLYRFRFLFIHKYTGTKRHHHHHHNDINYKRYLVKFLQNLEPRFFNEMEYINN